MIILFKMKQFYLKKKNALNQNKMRMKKDNANKIMF